MLKIPTSELTAQDDPYISGESSSDDDDDQDWADWRSDQDRSGVPCVSLFDENAKLASATDCLAHDAQKHGFDLVKTAERLGLDFHQRARLINYIRKHKPSVDALNAFTGKESFFENDAYLVPVIQNDPLLQLQLDNDWSDEDEGFVVAPADDLRAAQRQIKRLQDKLMQAKQDMVDYKRLVQAKMDFTTVFGDDEPAAGPSTQPDQRDDDTHYFDSYAENDIHAVMINDKVRTSTYASFIMRNPGIFLNKVVLDVGCGTGILSMFAARAGAKRVIAVDASNIVHRARQIVKDNDFEDIITVVHGKIEEISLPEDISHVDVIVSEWMGYALIYESMLDSVLVARDRFLKPGGILAPSHSRMMLALCEAAEIYKDRVAFWDDVYGFNMTCMASPAAVYEEAVIDVVPPTSLVSDPVSVRELALHTLKLSDSFSAPFTLTATRPCTKVRAFVLYFDCFFATDRETTPPGAPVTFVSQDEAQTAEVWPIGLSRAKSTDVPRPGPMRRKSSVDPKGKPVSFSTGPQSVATHWKQTIFLLQEPIIVKPGTVVEGSFFCRKSSTNSRELDVEIHYTSRDVDLTKPQEKQESATEKIIQMFKIR
ncbi:S-adenosyl-L-methionine-dependent methyltransferase [Auriculariales sp. MPI-PUGE-AT-0066]|nr:S-adenosyl-L-methionine-dependent methyltransferase [Auriculariales sp. MPI-PUGE-AT-0066]